MQQTCEYKSIYDIMGAFCSIFQYNQYEGENANFLEI